MWRPEQSDNRRLWGRALGRGDCPGDVGHLVSWYLSVLDNTGVVERDLGALLRSHQQHLGSNPDALEQTPRAGPAAEGDARLEEAWEGQGERRLDVGVGRRAALQAPPSFGLEYA